MAFNLDGVEIPNLDILFESLILAVSYYLRIAMARRLVITQSVYKCVNLS